MRSEGASCFGVGFTYSQPERQVRVLQDVSFEVRPNEFLSIVGPSGCGKTTLLRLLAGLLTPTEGTIDRTGLRAPQGGPPPMVFQENNLFPWMTVLENAAFGLEMRGIERNERESRAAELLARFGLSGRENDYPYQLSTGMKQRVGLVRAFLCEPPLLLMDEPFGALDCQTRMYAQQELANFWREHKTTVVFVTHDVGEAIILSDRILVLSNSPAYVVQEFETPLPRPRPPMFEGDPEMMDLQAQIFALLGFTLNSRAWAAK